MPCIASPQIYWSMQKKKIVRRENNEPTSYGKQTAFLFQTASLYSTGQTARSNTATAATSCPASAEANPGGKRKPLTKIGSAKYVRPSNRFQCIHTPNRSTGLPTGVCLRPRNCSSGEANRARRCRGWFQNFFRAKGFTGDSAWILPANSPQAKGGLSISRQTQPLFQGLSRCSVLLFVLLGFQ